MIRPTVLAFFCVFVAALAACSSGGTGVPLPQPGTLVAAAAGASAGVIYAPPGTADGGTIARTTGAALVQTTVKADGSFTLRIDPHPAKLTVTYFVQGAELYQDVQFASLASRVVKPLFGTGNAPNDMLLGNDSLYVANSLDNTVTRYALDGASLASASFPQYASPSFLVLDGERLWAVANGDNTVTALDATALTAITGQGYTIIDPAAAFIGPSQPAVYAGCVYVPRNQILSFAPTVYGDGKLTQIDTLTGAVSEIATSGRDPQYCAVDAARGLLYVTCTGEIQFDEQYHPHAESHSILDVFDVTASPTLVASVDLGLIGAQRIALSPDGNTAYLGNGLNGNLYKVDLAARTVLRGAANPILLTSTFTYISDVEFTPDGRWLLAASFNTDELYIIDPATDEVNPAPYLAPFNLALAPDMLAGCAKVQIGARPGASGKYSAYVLYAVGNAVARVDLF